VQARLLLSIFDSVYLFALAAWVGSVLFVSFGVAPIIFKVLDPSSASRFVRALFPRYYAWGVVSSSLALPAYLGVPLTFTEYRGGWVGVQSALILASILIFLYCGNTLVPAINTARGAGPSEKPRFDRLHKRSVGLNAVLLLVGIILLLTHATRLPPQTEGTLEMTPQERQVYDGKVMDHFQSRFSKETPPTEASLPSGRFPFDESAKKEIDDIVAAKQAEARKQKERQSVAPATTRP